MLSVEEGCDLVDIDEAHLPYILQRNLGVGGCCIVEEVKDLTTSRIFAHKLFLLSRKNRVRLTEAFMNEVKVIRALRQHRHMIRLFATYTSKDRLGLILSPVADGGDLDKFLGELVVCRERPMQYEVQIKSMVRILEQSFGCLADGLSFMRRMKIRHKDIKLKNILIHKGRVLYTDFGLSLDSTLFDNSITEGPTEMTRKYAAPELLSGGLRGSSSDVFSLACVFIEIFSTLTESLSYEEGLFSELMPSIHEQLDSIEVPAKLAVLPEVIISMSARNPNARWTADRVRSRLMTQAGLSCRQCRSKGTDVRDESLVVDSRSTQMSSTDRTAISQKVNATVSEQVQLLHQVILNLQQDQEGAMRTVENGVVAWMYSHKTFHLPLFRGQTTRTQREVSWTNGLQHIINIVNSDQRMRKLGTPLQPSGNDGILEHFLANFDGQQTSTSILQAPLGCLASGLTYMQENHIVNPDITLQNILVHEGYVIYAGGSNTGRLEPEHEAGVRTPCAGCKHDWTEYRKGNFHRHKRTCDIHSLGSIYMEILAALIGQYPLEHNDHNITASNIDHAFRALGNSTYRFLHPTILAMMHNDYSERPTATMVANTLISHTGFGCNTCQSTRKSRIEPKHNRNTASGCQEQSFMDYSGGFGGGGQVVGAV
ncbi:hypothetical protein HBI12_136150 [Parastagonospora nodorum]|nr:hypothetical protein HBI12_136150 [Parastagonospora nodorum]